MDSNQIGNYFQHNMLGDADGQDFDFNRIGSYFTNNFLTFNNNDFIKRIYAEEELIKKKKTRIISIVSSC